eukprot:11751498-Ditylum_brightwellii.AAC.1
MCPYLANANVVFANMLKLKVYDGCSPSAKRNKRKQLNQYFLTIGAVHGSTVIRRMKMVNTSIWEEERKGLNETNGEV